jgi:hypothetical protein
MGLLDIFSGVSQLLPGVGQAAKDIRQAITGEISPEKKADLALKAQELENQVTLLQMQSESAILAGQAEINKIEAASQDKFKSYWRPGVGWTCVLSLFLMFILRPIAQWVVTLCGSPVVLPSIDTETLMGILIPLLGIGGLRTVEKIQKK